MKIAILAAITFPILFVLDLLWIGLIGNGFYRSELGSLMRADVLWPAALAFYVIYCLGIAFFVLSPAIAAHSFNKVLLAAAFFGLIAYATYDLTNLATLNGWPVFMTFVDLAWGTFVTIVASSAAYLIATKLLHY